MGVQLGFNGAVHIVGKASRLDMRQVLDLTLSRYVGYVNDLAHDTREPSVVYWRIVFALLSVHTSLEATEAAYSGLRDWGRIPRTRKSLVNLLLRHRGPNNEVVQFPGQKADYLIAFDAAWQEDSSRFMPNGDRSEGWRDRLDEVAGLARMKASFAVCLSDPLHANVVCVDRHMARLLLGVKVARQLKRKEYDAAENMVRALARSYGVPAFAIQWCLWDAQRGSVEPHASLHAA